MRRGFLRGYFAAEGTISYHKIKQIICSMSFSYSPKKEIWLRNFCRSCLLNENVNSKYKESRIKDEGKIIISNWKNYIKFFEMNIFDRCIRKKDVFLKLLKRPLIYCYLNSEYRTIIFKNNVTQEKLAEIIKSTQGNVSQIIKGNRPLEVTQIIRLCKKFNKNINKIKRGIKKIQFYHSSTKIRPKKEFIDLIFSLRNL